MLSFHLGTVNALHWGFKPVLSYSKPHTFSTSLGEEKEGKNAFNLSNQAPKGLFKNSLTDGPLLQPSTTFVFTFTRTTYLWSFGRV